jgi:hypothetical protein
VRARHKSPGYLSTGHRGKIGAPKGTTLVTVLDVLVAFVIVAALIAGDAYLNHAVHLAPSPGDHTPGA